MGSRAADESPFIDRLICIFLVGDTGLEPVTSSVSDAISHAGEDVVRKPNFY
jgi:hypothetical protein